MVQSNAIIGVKMQVVLLSMLLQAVGLTHCQTWSDSNSGIIVKTLYLPLRKGRSSISLQDLNSARPLTTFNIPYLPVRQSSDLQTALNQNYPHKTKQYDPPSNQLQDVRSKVNGYAKPITAQVQVSNYQPPYSTPVTYSNVQLQSAAYSDNPNGESQNQFFQPQPYPNQQQPQAVQQYAYPSIQHTSDNGHLPVQSSPPAHTESSNQYGHSNVNLSEQMYPAHSFVPQKKPFSSTQLYSVQSQPPTYAQSYSAQNNQQSQYGSISSGQDVVAMPPKPSTTFAGESSRFVRQMQGDTHATHSSMVPSSFVQRPLPVSNHQQYSYAQQDSPTNQHNNQLYSTSQYQTPQAYDKRQLVTSSNQQVSQQQPLTSTYAIVHQRIPSSNYISQDISAPYQQTDYIQGSTAKQASDGQTVSSHTSVVDGRPVEYVKITTMSDNTNHLTASNHLASENHQVYPEIPQQTPKKDFSESSKNHASTSYPLTAKVHLVMPQYSSLQDSLPNSQYISQQPSSSGYQVVQNYDAKVKSAQQQNSAQSVYPDPNSETYYPEHRQVYMAPPQGYTSQSQSPQQHRQTQSTTEQSSASKYPSYSDSNVQYSQIPVSMQSEQLGIHIAIPNNY